MMISATTAPTTRSAQGPPVALRTARLTTTWLDQTTAVLAVSGEIDAANTDALREHIQWAARRCKRLILDLGEVGFFGIPGFSVFTPALSGSNVDWAVVPGAAVARVLRICDRNGVLSTANSVEEAAALLLGAPRPALQLLR